MCQFNVYTKSVTDQGEELLVLFVEIHDGEQWNFFSQYVDPSVFKYYDNVLTGAARELSMMAHSIYYSDQNSQKSE